jgi:secreted PhoX family phosphatase
MTEISVAPAHDIDDCNRSTNVHIGDLVEQRYSRRQTLLGGMSAAATAIFGGSLLAACGSDNEAPTVTAGSNVSTSAGRMVTLTGTATDDKDEPTASWTQVSGPSVTLTGSGATARFLAPAVATATPLTFRFTAMDSKGKTATADSTVTVAPAELGFTAVAKSLADRVSVPTGYSVSVLYALGDPLAANVSAYANNGTDGNFAQRGGDHHDGLHFFGLAATGTARDNASNTRGLLVMNHENISQRYLHPNGATTTGGVRPEAEALKEIEAHGVAVIEVTRAANDGAWSYVQSSALNRRITPLTPMSINGPVRGSAQVRTRFSTDGTQKRGTINNCANGYTPWGTYLTCEENYAGYFRRSATDNAARSAKEVTSLNRNGIAQGQAGNYGWSTVTPADASSTAYARWNASVIAGQPADGSGDFRNEPNHFGWVVEIDPYDAASVPRTRTALGRFAHEGAWPANFVAGRRPVYYLGDDSRGEYIYKFVSATAWDAADASAANRLAIGDKYLDSGTLYVARFNADGSGTWLPLTFGTGPLTAANTTYAFADQADVLINARLAGDVLGATKMDRPEWGAVNPKTGEVYFTLTNNNAAGRTLANADAANPRVYNDPKGATATAQRGNPNGHIIRFREAGDNPEATSFMWDIYAFGAGSDLDAANINLSALDATNDFSSPDGLWFARPSSVAGQERPLLWIQTDDGAYTDVTNCMMLAAIPGSVGDGGARSITIGDGTTTRTQGTFVGKAPGVQMKRFLVGPVEAEITGIDSTPDGRTIFVNIQHPGEDTTTGFPNTFPSNWPATQTNASATGRPRSATIVITKDDGGVVGL